MEIKDILDKLGLDLSNPEVRRGALDAIEAILSSRIPLENIGGGGGGESIDVEIDPDLLQPSVKHSASGAEDDIEVEDEENILDQVEYNDSEEKPEGNTSGNDSSGASSGSSDEDESDNTDPVDTSDSTRNGSDSSESDSDDNDDNKNSEESSDETADEADSEEDEVPTNQDEDSSEKDGTDKDGDEEAELEDNEEDGLDPDEDGEKATKDEDEEEVDEEDPDSEEEFDEEDFLDDKSKGTFTDIEITKKREARKIKRERTLAAAKKALTTAKAKGASPTAIKELENAIAALEALTEAVSKDIGDISDEEFNMLINRVLDAIDGVGDSDLTYISDEERELRAQEIKADLSDTKTQSELSAEDADKIRDEHQATRAREQEVDKYKAKAPSSFKGFQEFLNSLYRAIALQVQTNELRDDSWSAINRRYSGTGVLKQGQKIQDIPDKKIPVIDFYFDQSGSWGEDDLKVGMKAVSQLASMEEKGQIKLNIFYFADKVSSTPTSGGTSGWNEIVKNVIATQATNVIIMTDGDMQNWWSPQNKQPLRYTIPGYVWYLWRDGINAPRLPHDLKGRGGVMQFSFNASSV